MTYDMDSELSYGAARAVSLGGVRAWLTIGRSPQAPGTVFGRIVRAQEMSQGPYPGTQELLRAGPSVSAILRSQSQIGRLGRVAYLLRLPLDLEAARAGHARHEPGALTLAVPAGGQWDYLFYYFPGGFDLEQLAGSAEQARAVLAPLGEDFVRVLEPTVTLGGGEAGASSGSATVLCRPRRDAVAALEEAAATLQRRGWRLRRVDTIEPGSRSFVASREGREVWMNVEGGEQKQAWVCVLIAAR